MINVCVPTLRRYDLLAKLVHSLNASALLPDAIYVIDNGRSTTDDIPAIMSKSRAPIFVHTPEVNLGVAASWNWFLDNVCEDRIISNDDIKFAPESIAALVARPEDLVWGSGFSCFLIRDSCIEKLGRFDETISPGYGYYEDDDYLQRLDGRGTKPRRATAENVNCGIVHENSSTLRAATHEEILDHHIRFKIAQKNYIKKWHLEETFK